MRPDRLAPYLKNKKRTTSTGISGWRISLGKWRPVFRTGNAPSLERGDGLHLDQERLVHQPVDHEQRVRRVGAGRKQTRKLAQPVFHELGYVLRVHHVGRELDDVAKGSALRLERRLDIGEHLHALRVEVVGADHVAVLDRHLAGDEQELGGLYAGDVRVLAERLAQQSGVGKLVVSPGEPPLPLFAIALS